MTIHWWNYLLESLFFFGYLAVAFTLALQRRISSWPFLFTFAAFSTALTAFIVAVQGKRSLYAWHFYGHWIGNAVLALLGFGVVFEAVRHIPLVTHVPRGLKAVFTIAVATATIGCGIIAFRGSPNSAYILINFTLMLQRSISFAWAAFTLVLFFSISTVGLAWPSLPLRIAQGALIQATAAMAMSLVLALQPALASVRSPIKDALELIAVPYWLYALMRSEAQAELTSETAAALKQQLIRMSTRIKEGTL